ncbi:hypothetical protein HYDPIDRAFT_28804 [Hydnomerulius pinastri MD-312]|uniref:EF-hand domain-containing protein n=1 Tax=Hydnomerulius pinastri MD-312 TaxID=994086 RepID=A0A0C9WEZ4_9AGAM|nr:hypothetical protein HYDPIDRAFT_28804 [Hydnomerulius pinastri MD-312]
MSSANTLVGSDPDVIRGRIDRLAPGAEQSLVATDALIAKVAAGEFASSVYRYRSSLTCVPNLLAKGNDKEVKRLATKIVSGANQVIEVLEGLAELHPVAKATVTIFKALIKLELDRRDNNEQIAVICHSMTSLMYVLKYLAPIIDIDDGLNAALEEELTNIASNMQEFGNFSNVYYKYKNSIFRVCRSAEYKDRLSGFQVSFTEQKGNLQQLISYRVAIETHDTAGQIAVVAANVEKIISKLGESTPKEEQAAKFIQQKGGPDAVLYDDALLAGVAKILGEKLNGSMKTALRDDLDALLSANLNQFILKVDGAKWQIEEAVERSTSTILRRLDAGPHELIEDEDVKVVWKAINDHFEIKFRKHFQDNGVAHPDSWTLPFLSKVMYHPAIGDAIDEDGSGFVSVHECNHFIKQRPPNWSLPQWFAFWAAVWFDNNIVYYNKVVDIVDDIRTAAEKAKAKNKDGIAYYLVVLDFLQPIILDSLDSGIAENAQDDCDLQEFTRVQTEYMDLEQGQVRQRLEEADYYLEDENMLVHATKSTRIELSIMCLLTLVLEHHKGTIIRAQKEVIEEDKLVDMGDSLATVFLAFNNRMADLIRGWKQQRLTVALQVQCFAGGIYSGWYEESQKTDNALDRLLKFCNNEDDDEEEEESAETPDKMSELVDRVAALETRLGNIEHMLQILTGGNPSKPTVGGNNARSKSRRNDVPEEDPEEEHEVAHQEFDENEGEYQQEEEEPEDRDEDQDYE